MRAVNRYIDMNVFMIKEGRY